MKNKEFEKALDEIDRNLGILPEDEPQTVDTFQDGVLRLRRLRQEKLEKILDEWEDSICDYLNQIALHTWDVAFDRAESKYRRSYLALDSYPLQYLPPDWVELCTSFVWIAGTQVVISKESSRKPRCLSLRVTQTKENIAAQAYFKVVMSFDWLEDSSADVDYFFDVYSNNYTERVHSLDELFTAMLEAYKKGPRIVV